MMKFSNVAKICSIFLFLFLVAMMSAQNPATQVPLNPMAIPKFVDPLPHFAGARVDATGGGALTVKMVPHQQIAVSTGTVLNGGIAGVTPLVGFANLWAYRISDPTQPDGFTPANWPAFTIEAERDQALDVLYLNELGGQTYADVNLVVDQSLHWAMGMGSGAYTGPVPAVAHLHGGEVPPWSDGGPDAWFTPDGADGGHAAVTNLYHYPNTQEGATLWFHDHALGVTRLNVYAGLAAFYFLRDPAEDLLGLPGWSGDTQVYEFGKTAANAYLPEIEIVIQDRMFDTDGKLYFPNLPPNPLVHPTWTPEFVGDVITVNGKTWPFLSVAPRKYRFRLLNGSNARFYELWLQDLATGAPGPVIYQIGTDGGLLDQPVPINPALGQKLLMGPGERADVVVDFTGLTGTTWTMKNSGNTPFPKGAPPKGSTLGQIMQFVVNGTAVAPDNSNLPLNLKTNVKLTNFAGTALGTVDKTRQLTLNEVMGPGGPLEVLVNNTKWSGESARPYNDFTPVVNSDGSITWYSETPTEGETEVWQIINLTADAHPIHLHLVQYQLMSRQKFNLNKYLKVYNLAFPGGVFIGGFGPPLAYNAGAILGGNPDVTPFLQGPMKPANPNEMGWKDTFIMYPGEVTTVIVRYAPTDELLGGTYHFPFDPNGGHGYVWHCHIIDHEDNEMMRPYYVNSLNVTRPDNTMPLLGYNQPFADKGKTLAEGTLGLNVVDQLELDQNYPNPFNPTTQINFQLPEESNVHLSIYNTLGQEVRTLANSVFEAGIHSVNWDATDNYGNRVASGVYIYRIETNNFVQQKKMMLLK